MKIYQDISRLTGQTPLVRINKMSSGDSSILAKLEFFNPTSSIKDRIAVNMIDEAEREGLIKKGSVIIEPTSGNTGLGLAMVAAARGYKLIITMPETMSVERQKLMRQLGAEIVLTEGTLGMKGAVDKAVKLTGEISGSFMPQQFSNPHNPEIHYKTTGPEIWNDTDGKIDYFVAGAGTGGTITGAGKFLKEKNPDIKLICIEPAASPVLSGGKPGRHAIQGIGAGFVPDIIDTGIIDEIITVTDFDAIKTAKLLAINEGILGGISGGAALFGALEIASRHKNDHKHIVVIIPDTGERYISTDLFR